MISVVVFDADEPRRRRAPTGASLIGNTFDARPRAVDSRPKGVADRVVEIRIAIEVPGAPRKRYHHLRLVSDTAPPETLLYRDDLEIVGADLL